MDLISQVKMADVMMKFLRGDMTRIRKSWRSPVTPV